MLRVHILMDAVTQVEDVAVAVTETGQDGGDLFTNAGRAGVEHGGIHVALQRHLVADPALGVRDVGGPVQTQRIATGGGDLLQPLATVLGEQGDRHAATVVLADQAIDDLVHVLQGEVAVIAWGEHAAPGVKHHDCLGTRLDLGVEIGNHAVGQLVEQQVQSLRLCVHHLLDLGERLGAAPLHHVGGQGPGAAGESDERHFAFQLAADGTHRVHHVAEFVFRIRHRQRLHVGHGGDRTLEARAFTLFEVETEPHGIGHGEDVGEEDGGIERIAAQRLQGDLTSQLGVAAQGHEIPRLGAGGLVFRQIAASLAHHPYRGHVHFLAQQGTQVTIVLQLFHPSS